MIQDYALGIALLFMIGISFLVAFVASDAINVMVQNDSNMPSYASDSMQNFNDRFPVVMDWTFVILYIAVVLGVSVLSFFLQTNPGLYFVVVIIIVVMAGVAGFLANAFNKILESSLMGGSAANFPMLSFMIDHYMTFVLLAGFIMTLAFFAKPSEMV